MLAAIIAIAIIGFVGVVSHRRTRLEAKIIKDVPLVDWLTLIIFPILLFFCWVVIVRNVINRPGISLLPLDDLEILTATIFFMIYAFVGNAIHFTSKTLWRYLGEYKDSLAFKVNEMFHGKFSHYLVYSSSAIVIFLLPILEINHPLPALVTGLYLRALILAGIVFGACALKAALYTDEWFGGHTTPGFLLISLLLVALLSLFQILNLKLSSYPVSIFIFSVFISMVVTFLFREVFVLVGLNKKKSLKRIAKILSV